MPCCPRPAVDTGRRETTGGVRLSSQIARRRDFVLCPIFLLSSAVLESLLSFPTPDSLRSSLNRDSVLSSATLRLPSCPRISSPFCHPRFWTLVDHPETLFGRLCHPFCRPGNLFVVPGLPAIASKSLRSSANRKSLLFSRFGSCLANLVSNSLRLLDASRKRRRDRSISSRSSLLTLSNRSDDGSLRVTNL